LKTLRIRPLENRDYEELPRVLNGAFSGYRDATRYSPALLAFYREWMWDGEVSLVLASEEAIYGVLLAGIREAHFGGERLKVLHIGPAGIVQRHRRKGHGSEMIRQMTQAARSAQVDLLSLTTEAAYGAHRMYRRAGFDVLEAYRPLVRMVGLPAGEVASNLVLSESQACPPASPGRDKAIVELGPEAPPAPSRMRPRCFEVTGGRARSLQWPVITRRGDREDLIHATQLIHWEGGDRPTALAEAVCSLAAQDGSVCVYALRSTATTLPGFQSKGAPVVYRMVRGLSEAGKKAAAEAVAYDEICPAP
jgi:predicted N-acetyltransferase YhbS